MKTTINGRAPCTLSEAMIVISELEDMLAQAQRQRIPIDFERRVKVEQRLLDAFTGKKPLPTKEDCRELAHTLGIPDEFRVPCEERLRRVRRTHPRPHHGRSPEKRCLNGEKIMNLNDATRCCSPGTSHRPS
jgi:hypothetical protein